MSVWAVVGAIAISGAAGGIGGALISDEFTSDKLDRHGKPVITSGKVEKTWDRWLLTKLIVLGVLAAFAVPLFLVLASPGQQGGIIKNLMTETCSESPANIAFQSAAEALSKAAVNNNANLENVKSVTDGLVAKIDKLRSDFGGCIPKNEWWNSLLVLIGFCVVVGLVAQSFLGSIADRLVKEAKEAKDDAKQAAKEAAENSQKAVEAARSVGPNQEIDDAGLKVLKSFVTVKNIPASTKDIANESGLSDADAENVLDDLMEGGFVKQGPSSNSWVMRGWGKMRAFREAGGLSANDFKVLSGIKALKDGGDPKPTIVSIAAKADFAEAETNSALQRLDRLGLVAKSTTTEGGWRIRSWGKFALGEAQNS